MAEVPSTFQLAAGDAAPDFVLPRPTDNQQVSLRGEAAGLPTVVAFVSNHCPFVVHLADALGQVARAYRGRVQFIAIGSNDVRSYPQDGPEFMPGFQAEHGWDFSYLYDETQAVAQAYGAACTPDFFLFDADLRLVWAGQFDDSRPRGPRPAPATGDELRAALDAALRGEKPAQPWSPSTGCNIKWKPGQEPKWFAR